MSLSNQHPYSLFISGGLWSPSLARAQVEVGDNDNTYLASADIVLSGPLYPKLSTCFEGTRLTQLVQLVTAGRLFLGHKGQVDL